MELEEVGDYGVVMRHVLCQGVEVDADENIRSRYVAYQIICCDISIVKVLVSLWLGDKRDVLLRRSRSQSFDLLVGYRL